MKKNACFAIVFLFSCLLISISFCKIDALWHRTKKWIANPFVYIRSHEKAVLDNPYATTIASIRVGNDLHQQEQEYLQNRAPKIRSALEHALELSLEEKDAPAISLICSGGGYRAMLGSIGAFSGLQKIGLLDAIIYISSLSGSTWALGLWMSTGMTLKQLKNYVSRRLAIDFYKLSKADKRHIAHMFLVKIAFHQPFSTVDLFGAFIARHLLRDFFGDQCQMIHLSDQLKNIQDGRLPFPIYSAVDGRINIRGQMPWYEFTPLEIGSAQYGLYVPTWAYGRQFDEGESIDYAPEQSLGFHFGVFGSAYGGHFRATWDQVVQDLVSSQAKSIIENTLLKSRLANLRFAWARVRNFMRGMETRDALKKNKLIKMVDAGIEGNLPYIPLSSERAERKQDILIFFDFSKKIPASLRKAENYARIKNLKFPVIDYTNIEKKTLSIFKDENDTEVPIVIYMPRVSDHQLWQEKKEKTQFKKYRRIAAFDFDECIKSGSCYTTNFQYSLQESKQVMDQMEFNVVANQDKIIETIRWAVESKNK